MSELQKLPEQPPLQQEVIQFESGADQQEQSMPVSDLIFAVLRRWPTVLITCLLLWAVGIPAIWFMIEPKFETKGAVRISSVVPRIMYGDLESDRPMPNYDNFKNTEARRMGSDAVASRVADELANKGLLFFKEVSDPALMLRQAVNSGAVSIEPLRNTELITISMAGKYPQQAEQIIDSFIRAYMVIVDTEERKGGSEKLTVLEENRRTLLEKMDNQRQVITRLVDEFGTGQLEGRHDILLQTVARLQEELTNIIIRRISLETRLKIHGSEPNDIILSDTMADRKNSFINSDPTVQALIAEVMRYEDLVMVGKQNMMPDNPELSRRQEILDILRQRLDGRRKEVSAEFDSNIRISLRRDRQRQAADIKAELDGVVKHEQRVRDELEAQDTKTMEIGRRQRTIEDQREQFEMTKERYYEFGRRIEELRIESQRPARISVDSYASSIPVPNRRRKLAAMLFMGGLAAGIFLALLREKADKSVRVPQDVVNRVGIRIIGTTTSARHVDRVMLPQQLMDDYQTIRANLGLLDGSDSTRIIVITSPGTSDGKTTLAVNLAISFAKSGQKVLLIDGDLRKPDVAQMLRLPKGLRGFQDILFGGDFDKAVYRADSLNLDLLASDQRNIADAVDLLDHEETAELIRKISQAYDRVIIDTPPVLAFSDALILARMADGVIITSFAERTSGVDLKEAIWRLSDVNARILGTVMHNVRVTNSYHRYGYGYGYKSAHRKTGSQRSECDGRFLLSGQPQQGQDVTGDTSGKDNS